MSDLVKVMDQAPVLYHQFQGFEVALNSVRCGGWMRRKCWPAGEVIASSIMLTNKALCHEFKQTFIVKRTKKGLAPWLPSHDDLFGDDWVEAPQ